MLSYPFRRVIEESDIMAQVFAAVDLFLLPTKHMLFEQQQHSKQRRHQTRRARSTTVLDSVSVTLLTFAMIMQGGK